MCYFHVPKRQSITTPAVAKSAPAHPNAVGLLPLNGQSRMRPYSGPTLPNALTVRVSDYPALATVGGISQVSSTGIPVAVVRSGASSFRAFSLRCPHAGSTVQVTGGSFRCPNHGATFNSSGAWTGGERTSSLTELKVTANAAGDVLTITS